MNMPKIKFSAPAWPHVLGIDISNDSIKYVLLHRKGGKFTVENFGRFTYAGGGEGTDQDDFIEAIQKLPIDAKTLKNVKTVIGINDSNGLIKRENYPGLISKKELNQMISFSVERELNADGNGGAVISDYEALGPAIGSKDEITYLCFGAFEDHIDSIVSPFVSEGVYPVKILPQLLTYKNLAQLLEPSQRAGNIGIIDIGATRSTLIILRDGQLEYHRDISVGSADFTKAITGTIFHEGRAIQFSIKEAEHFKQKYGYPINYSEGMMFKGAPLTEVGAMMRPIMERLSGEIHRSLGFFMEQNRGEQVEALYVMGGGGQLKNLPNDLSNKIKMAVEHFPFPDSLELPRVKQQAAVFMSKYLELMGAVALALESNQANNLLPKFHRRFHQMKQYQLLMKAAVGVAVLVMLVITGSTLQKKSKLQNETVTLTQRVDYARTMGQIYTALNDSMQLVGGQIAAVDQMVKTDGKMTQILKMVSQTLPADLSLTRLAYDQEKSGPVSKAQAKKEAAAEEKPAEKWFLEIWGESTSKKRDIKMSLADFVLALEKSGYISSVAITRDVMLPDSLDETVYSFEMKAFIK